MIDAHEFEKAFAEALQVEMKPMHDKATMRSASMGTAMPLFSIESVNMATACALWPKLKPFLMMAISGPLSWWQPALAAQAKALITALDKTWFPAICGTQK